MKKIRKIRKLANLAPLGIICSIISKKLVEMLIFEGTVCCFFFFFVNPKYVCALIKWGIDVEMEIEKKCGA